MRRLSRILKYPEASDSTLLTGEPPLRVIEAAATGSCLLGSESRLKTAPRMEFGFTEISQVASDAPTRPKIAPKPTTRVYLPLRVTALFSFDAAALKRVAARPP